MTTIQTKFPIEAFWDKMTPEMAEVIKAEISKGDTFIAGGAPLHLVHPDSCPLKDFDVYHTFNAGTADFINALRGVGSYSWRASTKYNSQPQSDTSIMMIITFRPNENALRERFPVSTADVQIMICGNAMRDIRWFDFTCCSVYFDGESVKAFWPEDVIGKRLVLQKFAVDRIMEGNLVQLGRMGKYMRKGFRLSEPLKEQMPLADKPPRPFFVWARIFCGVYCRYNPIEFLRTTDEESIVKVIDDFILAKLESTTDDNPIVEWFEDIRYSAAHNGLSTRAIRVATKMMAIQVRYPWRGSSVVGREILRSRGM